MSYEEYEGIEANVKQFSYADGGPKDDFRRRKHATFFEKPNISLQ